MAVVNAVSAPSVLHLHALRARQERYVIIPITRHHHLEAIIATKLILYSPSVAVVDRADVIRTAMQSQ